MENKKKSNDKMWVLMGWIFLACLIFRRTLAIIFTHDDVAGFGDFVSRLGIWDFFELFLLAVLIVLTIFTFWGRKGVGDVKNMYVALGMDVFIAILGFWLIIPWILEYFELTSVNPLVVLIYAVFICLLYLQLYMTSFKGFPNTPKAIKMIEDANSTRRIEGRSELSENEVKKMLRNSLLRLNAIQLAVISLIFIGGRVVMYTIL